MKPGELAALLARGRTERTGTVPPAEPAPPAAIADEAVAAKILAAARAAGVLPSSKE